MGDWADDEINADLDEGADFPDSLGGARPMSEWTDDEIEEMARAFYCAEVLHSANGGLIPWHALSESRRGRRMDEMRAAISAVSRAPKGCWIAPNEPTEAMQDAVIDARLCEGYPMAAYRAMRDAHKGGKADG